MMKQQNQMQNKLHRQENKTDLRDVLTTFITEGTKVMATGGASLGATLGQVSLKQMTQQGIKKATKVGLKQTIKTTGKVMGQAAMNTAQKLDNQDDDKLEMADLGLALFNQGRGGMD